jgi:phenylpropionate dioxygenase-like ring-hydroxylating dioxygenase large terminal subunit
MNRSAAVDLTRRLIHHIVADTTDEADSQWTEPAASYLDPARFEREREQLFLDEPHVIGFAGDLAKPNSYFTAEAMNIPIVATRGNDGTLRAFINACAHRGAQVAEGQGAGVRLTCRFHGWSYALDGTLAGRPKSDAFDPPCRETNLVSLPISDRCGLLVVGLRSDFPQARVDRFLDDIAPALGGFRFAQARSFESRRIEVAANWKLVVGLSHESYHFATLHRDSLAPMMTSHAVIDTFGQHSRWAFPLRGLEKIADAPESEWPDRPAATINHTLYPGTLLIVNPRDAQLLRTEPGATPGTSVIHYLGMCEDPDTLKASRAAYDFGGKIFEAEDLPAAIQCQRGLEAGRPNVIFGRNEPLLQHWHRKWAAAIGD